MDGLNEQAENEDHDGRHMLRKEEGRKGGRLIKKERRGGRE